MKFVGNFVKENHLAHGLIYIDNEFTNEHMLTILPFQKAEQWKSGGWIGERKIHNFSSLNSNWIYNSTCNKQLIATTLFERQDVMLQWCRLNNISVTYSERLYMTW